MPAPTRRVSLPGGWHLTVPVAMFAGSAGVMGIFTSWLGLEAWLLATAKRPITSYLRPYLGDRPRFTFVLVTALGFGLGAGVAHFVWDVGGGVKPKLHPPG